MRSGPLEITDLLWSFADDGGRRPVRRSDVLATLRERGQPRAARIVAAMPEREGRLCPEYVDALGLRVHCELQRLGEELQLGRRVAATVTDLLRRTGLDDGDPVRLVDIGCGLGHVLRSIAAYGDLPPTVELVGVDLNPVLVAEAVRLADLESLACTFVRGDALLPGVAVERGERTVLISSGLMHHLAAEDLTGFLAAQAELGVAGFAHWDLVPGRWSTLGAWIFHRARMREPVSRHDGVLSARRAHPVSVLTSAARHGAPAYASDVLADPGRWTAALDVLRPLVGVR